MKKFIIGIVTLALGLASFNSPAMATSNIGTFGIETAVLTTCGAESDGKNGEGITCILNLVVDILTVGVGILGVIGITIVGIQYLTAGGSEEKVRKSKRRMFEIIIGLVAYVVLYAALKWLLPSFGQ